MSTHAPDPVLSASIFTDRPLDSLLAEVVRPFWEEIREGANGSAPSLWFLRYARGGQHLKLRVHGSEDRREGWAERLSRRTAAWLASPEERSSGSSAPSPSSVLPAIDADDAGPDDLLPPGLTWTTYSRHDLVLGDRRLLRDDEYVRLFTRCLGHAMELLLARWDDAAAQSASFRQGLLVRLVGRGTAALWPDPAERRRYLAYHRDWMIRYPVLHSSLGTRNAQGILALYVREAERAREALPQIAALGQPASDATDADEARWLEALRALRSHVEGMPALEQPADPFAADRFSPILLRLFHDVANAFGFNPTTEGLLHHLLLQTLGEPEHEHTVLLLPEERTLPSIRDALAYTEEIELFQFNDAYDWWSLTAAGSSAGREWGERYRELSRPVTPLLKKAIQLLRRKQLDEGAAALVEAEAAIAPLERQEPATYHVLRRFYLGSEAYLHYLRGDYPEALRAMSGVGDALRAALWCNPALLPLAPQIADVPLKELKIAQARCDWAGMTAAARDLLDLVEDRTPLCHLADGTPVTHAAIGERLRAAIPAGGRDAAAVTYLLETPRRLVWLRRNLEILYARTGAFIWHSPRRGRPRADAAEGEEVAATTPAAAGPGASDRPSPPRAAPAATPA